MATAIESGVGTLNYGRQSAKGTKATAATTTVGYNRPKILSTGLKSGKTLNQEEYVDGQRFASPTMFTDRVGGNVGSVSLQVQPENAGLYPAAILGVDTVTGASDPYTHTITSAGTSGQWGTWWQKVGSAIGPVRHIFWDSKISKLTRSAKTDQKVMHYDLDIAALVAGEVFTTDAAKTEDSSDPYLWTEVSGALTFDGTVNTDINEEILTIETGIEPWYGDNITPGQLIEKKGSITYSLKSIVTDDTILKFNKAIFNATAPTAGTVPVKDVFYAAVSSVYTRSVTRTMTTTLPRVAVDPADMVITPLVEGGPEELVFGGPCLKSGGTPAVTIVVLATELGFERDVILYQLPWAEAARYHAILEDRHAPATGEPPSTLASLHEHIAARTRGHG